MAGESARRCFELTEASPYRGPCLARAGEVIEWWAWRLRFAHELTSLRANGSRECAPDDGLREATHAATRGKNGLLRRHRSLAQTLRVCRRQRRTYAPAAPSAGGNTIRSSVR